MNWFLMVALCCLLVELVLRLPFLSRLDVIHRSSRSALRVVTAKAVSEHWKEKAMRVYARRTFIASVQLTGLLVILLCVAALLVLGLDQLSNGFQSFILSWSGIGSSIAVAGLYVAGRRLRSGG